MILALILALACPPISASDIVVTSSIPTIDYPVRLTYVNRILDWSSGPGVAKSMGVPGYAPPHKYNYICFAFWTYFNGPLDVALVWNNSLTYFGNTFGSTDADVRSKIKKIYNDNGIRILVSAFGATENPTTSGVDPIVCAKKLADFVMSNNLDGVDVDWEDTAAFQYGTGEQWLIDFTSTLRSSLPTAIITHAPQAPYFGGTSLYPKNAYIAIEKAIGPMIQFYNIQFYNQGSTGYNSSNGLFNSSGGWAPGTSVNEIIAKGIASNKIVVGKPASTADANAASFMSASSIGDALVANFKYNGWKAGIMFWQYSSDPNGTICSAAITPLITALNITTNTTQNTTTNSTNNNSTNSTGNSTSTNSTGNSTSTNSTNNSTNSTNNVSINYPVRFTYINRISDWSTIKGLAKSLAIPGYAPTNIYNYVCLGFWTYSYGPVDSAILWHNPTSYFGKGSQFGSTDEQIRTSIKQIYSSKGIKLMLGVFGVTDLPSTFGFSPAACAQKVATYASSYSFDGVDINWNDMYSFILGKGESWLADFTLSLRALAPNLIITHSPLASYFSAASFPKGGYVQVNKLAGSAISFYNVIYYGQSSYNTYSTTKTLFNVSGGTYSKTSVN